MAEDATAAKAADNTYELTYILNAVLNDEQLEDLVQRVDKFVEEHGGTVLDKNVWGTQRLAYPIEKRRNGFYVNLTFQSGGELIARLERALDINDNVLRYLTLKMDKRMIQHRAKRKAAAQEAVEDAEKDKN